MHLGGKLEVTPKVPLRHRDDLSRAYTPGVARVCLAIAEQPRGRPPADDQAQHRRRRHRRLRRARAGQHRAGCRAAGDGGQGRAVQAVRGRRRVAGLPGHPGHRRDRRDRARHRPGLRRDQPRGHRRAALLRDRGAAAGDARHPRLPRRPARHRDRRARRADQRAARGRARRCPTSGSSSRAPAPPGRRSSGCCWRRAPGTSSPATPAARVHTGRDGPRPVQGVDRREHQRGRLHGTLVEVLAGADVFIGVSAPRPADRRGHRHDGRARHRVRARQPRPRGRPARGAAARRRRRHRPLRLPEPDQQRARVPRRLPRAARRRRAGDHRRDAGRGRARDRRLRRGPSELNAELHRAERVRPGRWRRRSRPPSATWRRVPPARAPGPTRSAGRT